MVALRHLAEQLDGVSQEAVAHVPAQEGCEGDHRGRVGDGGERQGGVGEGVTAQGEARDERVVGGEVPRGHPLEDAERGVGEVIAEVAGKEGVVGSGGPERHGLERGAGALHVPRACQPGDTRVRVHYRRRRARRQEADGREAHGGKVTSTAAQEVGVLPRRVTDAHFVGLTRRKELGFMVLYFRNCTVLQSHLPPSNQNRILTKFKQSFLSPNMLCTCVAFVPLWPIQFPALHLQT